MQKMTHRFTIELQRMAFEEHENCVTCGYKFQKGDTTHLGYGPDDQSLYVCDSCSNQLKETAVRYSFSPKPYEVPTQSSHLWRYIDFTKYVSLLLSSGLHFARADTLGDSFEGAKGLERNKEQWNKCNIC